LKIWKLINRFLVAGKDNEAAAAAEDPRRIKSLRCSFPQLVVVVYHFLEEISKEMF
jgi:hypothetical protein